MAVWLTWHAKMIIYLILNLDGAISQKMFAVKNEIVMGEIANKIAIK